MAVHKDDLGIEVDEEVFEFLNDPKSQRTLKVLDYYDKRKKAEAAKAQADKEAVEKAENDKKQKSKLFGIFD